MPPTLTLAASQVNCLGSAPCWHGRRRSPKLGPRHGDSVITDSIRIIGIDPGLRHTGWGIIETAGSRLSFIACGTVHSKAAATTAERLGVLHEGLASVIFEHAPLEAAVEETFVNRDPQSALKLGHARGIALVVPALAGLSVHEYAANLVSFPFAWSETTFLKFPSETVLTRAKSEARPF